MFSTHVSEKICILGELAGINVMAELDVPGHAASWYVYHSGLFHESINRYGILYGRVSVKI